MARAPSRSLAGGRRSRCGVVARGAAGVAVGTGGRDRGRGGLSGAGQHLGGVTRFRRRPGDALSQRRQRRPGHRPGARADQLPCRRQQHADPLHAHRRADLRRRRRRPRSAHRSLGVAPARRRARRCDRSHGPAAGKARGRGRGRDRRSGAGARQSVRAFIVGYPRHRLQRPSGVHRLHRLGALGRRARWRRDHRLVDAVDSA